MSAFEARYYDPPRHYGGPWAWFRMIDENRQGAPDAQQRIRLKIQDRYHQVDRDGRARTRGRQPVRHRGLAAIQLRIVNRACR